MSTKSIMHKIQLVVFLSVLNVFTTMVIAAQAYSPDNATHHGAAVAAQLPVLEASVQEP